MKLVSDEVFKAARDEFLRMPSGTVRKRDDALRAAMHVALNEECKGLRAELSELRRQLDLESRRAQAFEDAEPDVRKVAEWALAVAMRGTDVRSAAERILAYRPEPAASVEADASGYEITVVDRNFAKDLAFVAPEVRPLHVARFRTHAVEAARRTTELEHSPGYLKGLLQRAEEELEKTRAERDEALRAVCSLEHARNIAGEICAQWGINYPPKDAAEQLRDAINAELRPAAERPRKEAPPRWQHISSDGDTHTFQHGETGRRTTLEGFATWEEAAEQLEAPHDTPSEVQPHEAECIGVHAPAGEVLGCCAKLAPDHARPTPDWHAVGDDAFARPFGTVRVCLGCGALVAGGPTRCGRCAEDNAQRGG